MGDEVTRKDLQSLQGTLNRQIADLDKKVSAMEKKFNKGLDDENAITVNVRHALDKRLDGVDTRFTEVQNSINTLARAVGDLANKVDKK